MEGMTLRELIARLQKLAEYLERDDVPVSMSVNAGEYEIPVRHANVRSFGQYVLIDDEMSDCYNESGD